MNTTTDELLVSRFTTSIDIRVAAGKVPQCMIDNPLLVGQVMHEASEGCSVYLMACKEKRSDVQYIKIGLARDIRKRVASISTGCPLKIKKILYFCVGSYGRTLNLESELHEKFSRYRTTGEWFCFDSKEETAEQVGKIIKHVEDYLMDGFNMYVFDPAMSGDPNIKETRKFVTAVWEHLDGRYKYAWVGERLSTMSWNCSCK